jgi:ferric iron reductase protein FhuF
MQQLRSKYPMSRLYEEHHLQKKGRKIKKECCHKYLKKKGKYCKSCPTLHAITNGIGRNL